MSGGRLNHPDAPHRRDWSRGQIAARLTHRVVTARRGDDDLNPGMIPDPPPRLTPAAVLVGLVERADGFHVLLTQRTAHLRTHAGQISFPGGKVEDVDSSPVEAALRETYEEVGLPDSKIDVVGALDPYVTRTGFRITPVVGFITPPFDIRPDAYEVAEVFETPLTHFMTPGVRRRHSRDHEGRKRYFYAMPYKDYYIWGATAGMLVNLVDMLIEKSDAG
ncbi:MAG: CoA pyrophosphatase [Alphaproteobacteria bacterium]|nr:CoA pyrophosphatase [Alphaproteobacteria bacterium]